MKFRAAADAICSGQDGIVLARRRHVQCPTCNGSLTETEGSPVSPYINVYTCEACGWHKLRCGNSACESYMEGEPLAAAWRYTCVTCGWTGTGGPFL